MSDKKAIKIENVDLKNLFSRKYKESVCNFISRFMLALSDCLVFIVALLLSQKYIIPSSIVFYQMGAVSPSEKILVAIDWHYILMVACVFYFRVTGHYTRRQTIWDDAPKVFFAILFSAVFDTLMLSISSLAVRPFSEVVAIYFLSLLKWFLLFLSLLILRDLTKRLLALMGFWQKPTVIIGVGDNARQTYLALSKEKTLGFTIKLFVDINKKSDDEVCEVKGFNIPIVKLEGRSKDFFKKLGWPHVIIALEEKELKKAASIIDSLTIRPNSLDVIPPVRGFALYGLDVSHIFGSEILLLRARNNLARCFPRLLKRFFDIIVTILVLTVLSPLLAFCLFSIRKDGGYAFYGHKRVGHKGKPFYCLKFRSMVLDADKCLAELLEKDPEAKQQWDKDFKLKKRQLQNIRRK